MAIIGSVQTRLAAAWTKAGQFLASAKSIVLSPYTALKTASAAFWQHKCKPIYDYRIKPINKTDGFIFLLCVGIGKFAARKLEESHGKSIGAIATGVGVAIGSLSLLYTMFRIEQIYKDEMWDKLAELRKEIFKLSHSKKLLTKSHLLLKQMHENNQVKPLPEWVVTELENLNRRCERYSELIHRPPYMTYQQNLITHLDHLIAKSSSDILKNFKAEIEKMGTSEYDFKKARGFYLQLKDALPEKDFQDVQREYLDASKAYDEHKYPKEQKELLKFIEDLQKKLNWFRENEKLVPEEEPPKKEEPKKPADKPKPDKDDVKKPADKDDGDISVNMDLDEKDKPKPDGDFQVDLNLDQQSDEGT